MTRKVTRYGVSAWGPANPPLDRTEASNCFGTEIPEDAWCAIEHAYLRHAGRMANLLTSRANKNRNDKRSFETRKTRTASALEAAFKSITRIDREFITELEFMATSNYISEFKQTPPIMMLNKSLNEVSKYLFSLLIMVERAEAEYVETPSEKESRRLLVCEIFEILKPYGASLSNGWSMELGEPSYEDLTGFERLIESLGIHQGNTPKATSK